MAVNVPINFFANVDDAAKEFGKLTGVLKGVAAAFAVKQIVDGISNITSAAADAEESSFRMAQSLRLAGDYSEQNVKAFEALAEQIQANTKYDDDLVLSQVAVAKQFGATNKEAEKLILAATDLAAATGTELPSAVQLLGKSLDGTAGKLNEIIPGMRSLNSEQLAAGAGIDLVARRFKGAAEGELSTFNGAIKQLQNNFGNMLESLGKGIVENNVLKESIRQISKVFQILKKTFDENGAAIRDFVSTGIIFAVDAFSVLASVGKIVYAVFSNIGNAFAAVIRGVSTLGERLTNLVKLDFSANEKVMESLGLAAEEDAKATKERVSQFDSLIRGADAFSKKLGEVNDKQKLITEETKNTKNGLDDQKPAIERASSDLIAIYASLQKKADDFSETQSGIVDKRVQSELAAVETLMLKKIITEENGLILINKLQKNYDKERKDARLADIQKEISELQKIASSPISFALGFKDTDFNKLGIGKGIRESISAGLGAVGQILQGKQGATNLLSGFAEQMGQAFLGIPGMGAIFSALAQGPDQVRAMVTEFANAVPDIVVAVLESLPVLIETLAENLDEIIIRLVEKLGEKAPNIATAIVRAIAITLPLALAKASAGFLQAIYGGAFKFVGTILEGIGQFVGKLIEGAGRFIDELIKRITGQGGAQNNLVPGLPNGGGFVPGLGGPNGGITIVPGVSVGGGGGGAGVTIGIPGANISFKGGGQQGGGIGSTIIIPVQIGMKQMAEVIVDLNRYGYRLEPA